MTTFSVPEVSGTKPLAVKAIRRYLGGVLVADL